MSVITMKQLLEAGAHFGHQTRKWNPKMAPYIFGARNQIHILDLQKTLKRINEVYNYVREIAAQKKKILFVGTKRQAQETIEAEAQRCGMFYINQRWWGGVLTNFPTIRKSIARLKKLEDMETSGDINKYTKKEGIKFRKEKEKLERGLKGIKNMESLPDAIFVVDPMQEEIAIAEARKLKIPIIGIVDTDCNPDDIDYIIPANDDAIRAIKLLVKIIADAVLDGLELAQKEGAGSDAVTEMEDRIMEGKDDTEET